MIYFVFQLVIRTFVPNMRKRYLLLFVALMLLCAGAQAQHRAKRVEKTTVPDTAQIVRNYIDSLNMLRQQLDSVQQVNNFLRQESTDGRYYRLFAPTTFYHSGAYKTLSLNPKSDDEVADAIDEALMNVYMRRPDLVKNDESNLRKAGSIREDVNKELTQQVNLTDIVTMQPDEPEVVPVKLMVQKPHFWKFKGDGYLQFLQNYVSELRVRQLAQGW